MATFTYSVRDKAGKVTKGKLDAENKEAVQAKLTQMGYIILELNQQSGLASLGSISFGTGVKSKDVTIFARQFSTMINAGLSLTKCLTILAGQTDNAYLREIIGQLGKDVEAGQSLSDALSKHPKVFPPIFVNMVRAGETGGVLDDVLARVADYFETDDALNAKIKSAMTYPIAMGGLVGVVLVAMLLFVVPTFEKMFKEMGGKLPAMTQFLVDLSGIIASWKGIAIAAGIVAFVQAWKWWTHGPGRRIWDGAKLNMPIFGDLIRKMVCAKFTRTFGTLVTAGVPILSSLEIVGSVAGNVVIEEAIMSTRAAIKEGETLARPLAETKVFPSMLTQMIAVGEETGALDVMLNKIADFYEEEVSTGVDGITSLIEPLMMASLGVVVGGMVVALYLPMFTVITLVK